MPGLDGFPTSGIDMLCLACLEPKRVVVCYCGEDVCLPCLREHQKTCSYTHAGKFRCDELEKKRKKKAMGENIRKAVGA